MYSFLFRNVKMAALLVILSIATYAGLVYSIQPSQCFAKFRWDDCGKPPTPVLYYWKPGSRCEVGIWRGCLPNMNMFKDEYECVTTCIFTVRAADADFHQINADDDDATIDNYDGVNTESDDSNESDDPNEGGDTGIKDYNVTTVEGGTDGANDTTTDSADNLNSTENKSDVSGDAATTPEDTAADAESTTESEVPITTEAESVSDPSTTEAESGSEAASATENESESTTGENEPSEPDS